MGCEAEGIPFKSESFPNAEEVLKVVNSKVDEDKLRTTKGDILWWDIFADTDQTAILRDVGWDKFLAFNLTQIERRLSTIDKLSHQQGRLVKIVRVMDMDGVKISGTNWELVKLDGKDVQPVILGTSIEVVSRVYMINVPGWFYKPFEKFFHEFIPKRTLARFRLLGKDFMLNDEFVKDVGATTIAQMRATRRSADSTDDALVGEKKIVAPGRLKEVVVLVMKGKRITWEFVVGEPGEVEDKKEIRTTMGNIMDATFGTAIDLAFKVVALPEAGDDDADGFEQPNVTTLVEPQSYNFDDGAVVKGEAVVPFDGMVVLNWSNERCWIRSKLLTSWRVEVES